MTNPTGGYGLRAVRRLDGAALTFQTEAREIAYNQTSHVIAKGDIVKILNTGYIDLYANGDGNTLTLGVFDGCTYLDPNLGYKVWRPVWNAVSGLASTQKVTAYVILPDPQMVFEIRANGNSAVALANIGQNADVIVGSPTVPPGLSVALLDQTTIANTSTFPLRIVGLGQGIDNDNTLKNNVVEVIFNGSSQATLTGHS